jgi:hypothetical protein
MKTCDVLVTDPSQRGTLEHNNELIIFACEGSDNLDYILHDGYKLYIDGELAERQIANKLFNTEAKNETK